MIYKTLFFVLISNVCFSQNKTIYTCSFKIADVQQKEFKFSSEDDLFTISLKERIFIDSKGREYYLVKSGGGILVTSDGDTLAAKKRKCIYYLPGQLNASYHVRGRTLYQKNDEIISGKIRFRGNEVAIVVTKLDNRVEKSVMCLFFHKLLLDAKAINESNLFFLGIN